MRDARTRSFEKAFPPGVVCTAVPFSALTTWGVGGPAEILVRPSDGEEAARAVRLAVEAGLECRVVGWGSNLLASDRGVAGVVIRPSDRFDRSAFRGRRVVGEPGLGLATLSRECARRGLSGLEFAAGIPGSLGGAVATNAGAEGTHTGRVVEEVQVLRRSGAREVWGKAALGFRYRGSRLLDEPAFVLSATLELEERDPAEVEERTRALLEKRKRQPVGRSAGSVFRNPEADYAGRLLEMVGAKGMAVGGARVPEEHANFIVTAKGASARDVVQLVRELQERVLGATGVLLAPEVVFVGFEDGDPDLPRGARFLGEIA